MDIRRLDDGTGIEATLIGNNAKYHNICGLIFNSTKLLRVQNRVTSQVPSTNIEESPKLFKGSMDRPDSSTNTDKEVNKNVKNTFLSMCDVKLFLTFTSMNLVLL